MSKTIAGQRDLNLDLIRCTAALSVVGVHFFLYSGFYSRYIVGSTMLAMVFLRTACMVCVPLFALLTGYLCGHKRPGGRHMVKLLPVLLTYLLCSIMTLAVRNLAMDARLSVTEMLVELVTFQAAPYAWYVGMYIGLYLLIPFLNGAYQGLKSQREKHFLLLTMALLTVLPNSLNCLIGTENKGEYLILFPDWWEKLWPVTYYFLGSYIREYRKKIPPVRILLLLLLHLSVVSVCNFLRCGGDVYIESAVISWGSMQNTVNAVLVFLLILNLDLSRLPRWMGKGIGLFSRLSLGIYLCSWISDKIVYPLLGGKSITTMLLRMPLLVGCSFVLAAVLAQVVMWVQTEIEKRIKRK